MAVVQISKIQVRRGQKNSNSGIPQLSSAEFAWAVDSQELFIGNGSVAEGAPYVGNTKVLTEHDNILDLASGYQFASNDTSISLSVSRSLQSKLDEYVSVTDFGAIGDGSTDCVAAFQTAFSQLFRNADSNFKKVLMVPNGEYLFSSDLAIPDGVILRGETQLGAILNLGSNNIRFITSAGLELVDFNSGNRPKNISISNLTIQRTSGQLTLSGVADSVIEDVKFSGQYLLDSTISPLDAEPSAIFWENDSFGTLVDNIKIKNCLFEKNSINIKCSQSTTDSTSILIQDCKFFESDTAIYINGTANQGTNWQINDCEFEEIANQAFRSTDGLGTMIQRCRFTNVANGSSTAENPESVMIYFGQDPLVEMLDKSAGNTIINCSSNRQRSAGLVSTSIIPAYAEVYNASAVSLIDRNYMKIQLSDSFRPLAVFSAINNYTTITYSLTLGEHSRFGTLTILIGDDLSMESHGSDVSISDNYTYSPNTILSPGGALMTNFQFSVTKTSNTTGDDSSATVADTIVLSYKNPLANGKTGSISFDVAYGV